MQVVQKFPLNYKQKFVKFYLKLKSLLLFIPIIHFRDYLQKKKDEKCYFQVHKRMFSTTETLIIKSRRALCSFSF